MGIPLFFRYLVNNYDNIITNKKHYPQIDNLYLDLNCAIHYCCREILKDITFSKANQYRIEGKMINNVIKYIEILLDYSNPQKLLYIAIDGPAPKAKMIQQRQRRFKKYYEKNAIEKIKRENGVEIIKQEEWDTNAITPGTVFMQNLSIKLKTALKTNSKCKHLNIIISDSNVPGEGEHKLLHHLKENNSINNSSVNAIYGLDADLIMLCISSKLNNILLLREAVEFNNAIHVKGYKFLYLHIDNLKDNLISEIKLRIDRKHISLEEKNRILDDYIFFSVLLGNDFLPHTPTLSIKHGGIDLIFDLYTRYYDELKSNLVDTSIKKINHDFLKSIIRDLGLMEDSLLQDYINKRNRKRKPNKPYESEEEKQLDLLNLYPQFNRDSEIKIDFNKNEWRDRMYDKIFLIRNKDIKANKYEVDQICHRYLEGIFWNFHYYNYGCVSWEWNYPYPIPPSFNDIYNYMNNFISNINHLEIEKARPLKPFEQLLSVLPQQSAHLLPQTYQKLMTDMTSPIIEYYPDNYNIETIFRYYLWECPPVLPIIITKNIKEATVELKLNKDESNRNKLGKEFIITH
jgi:5'-3' exoribonuclease 1